MSVVLCDHGNPTIGDCSDCEAEAQADRAPLVARDPGRKVTEKWLDNADSRTLVEAHLFFADLKSKGADRAQRCLSAILRRYESESVPAEVREWCEAQADAAEKRHDLITRGPSNPGEQGAETGTAPGSPAGVEADGAGESPAPTLCQICGKKPKTTSLFRADDVPRYLCDACYRTEWVCGACGLTLPDRNADCAECGTTSAIGNVDDSPIDNSQLGASDNPNNDERPERGFFEATDPASTAPSASISPNPAAPEDAPSVPSPAPPSSPPTPEGDEPDGAAGVGLCSCGSLERTRVCRGCGFAYCDSCRAELGDECRQPCCAPCDGCGDPVSVAVESATRPGRRLCGDCEQYTPIDPDANVHKESGRARLLVPIDRLQETQAELVAADQRADRAEDRAERLQAAVENLGRALVKERQSNPSRMRQSVSMGSDTIPHPAPLDLSDLFSDDPSEPPADNIPAVLARAFGETTGGAVFGPPSPDPAALALSSLPIAHQLDLAMTGLQQSFSALRLLRDWLDTANRAIAMGEHCGQPFCSRNDYHTHEPPIVDAGPVRASPRMHL